MQQIDFKIVDSRQSGPTSQFLKEFEKFRQDCEFVNDSTFPSYLDHGEH